MEPILAVVAGALFAAGVYLLLQRNLIRILFGVIVITNAVNVLIFTMGRLTRGDPPVAPEGATELAMANPLPQALVLTAIVISFGLAAFILLLIYRTEKAYGTLDSDRLNVTDQLEEHAE